jgi:succinyl-diaminopimelate desuccinylase
MSEVVDLACELIRRRSLTPDDAGCMALLASRLERAGFRCERLRYGEVSNLWATHGAGGPVLAFLGHVDVVPSGPEADWTSKPFEPTVRDDKLYGRGAADMKSGVAAMVVALEQFATAHPDHAGTVALLLTSDEEGPSNLDGVRRVAQYFRDTGQRIDWCLVGEPTAKERLGDLIRVGRRGSLSGVLTVRGVQGHVAYPQLARNPIHLFAPPLAELAGTTWDGGNDDFPPTSFQVSNVNAGTGAYNVVPGSLVAHFNFRFGTASSAASLRERTEAILEQHALDYAIDWNLSGEPFHSPAGGRLRETVIAVCRELCGIEPEASTGGGTSDGRFIAPLGAEVVEIGPVNATIHKIDECIAISDLERLPAIHLQIMRRLLAASR